MTDTPRRLRQAAAAAMLPTAVIAADLLIRHRYLANLTAKGARNYLLSIPFELLLLFALLWPLSRLGKWRWPAAAVAALALATVQVVAYGHYAYFGVLPNVTSLDYLWDNAHYALSLMTLSLRWYHVAAWAGMGIGYAALIRWLAGEFRRWSARPRR